MNRYAQMISELKTPEVMKRLTYLYGQRGGMLVAQSARYSRLLKRHEELIGYEGPIAMISAPGRTEIGGNHTDHNRGKVLAAAVNLDTLAAVSPRTDGMVNIHSEGYAPLSLSLDDLSVREDEKGTTAALVRGVADGLQKAGMRVGGFDAVMTSTVRSGSGLSSSAAVEVLLCAIFDELYNDGKLDFKRCAQISQYAENVYFGKPSGLMDQMASSAGGLVYIDFQNDDPEVREISYDFATKGYALVVVNSGGSHDNLTDFYAAIPQEMRSVAKLMGKEVLGETNPAEFYARLGEFRGKVPDRALLRAMHFYGDNQRVLDQADALRKGDFQQFLALVRDSGASSMDLLQNIYPSGDPSERSLSLALALCRRLLEKDGAWRVHGGGFAGTVQAFVPVEQLESFRQKMEAVFGAGTCHDLSVRPAGGIKVMAEGEV